MTILWTAEAEERVRRMPIRFVRLMIIRRIEAYAKELGLEIVDLEATRQGGERTNGPLLPPTLMIGLSSDRAKPEQFPLQQRR